MTSIAPLGFVSHLRAEPNEFILHFRSGKLARSGAGLAYWFLPLRAAIAMLPVQDVETTFVLTERTADYQDIAVQCTLVYRVVTPDVAATRVNFSVSLITGAWIEQPLERLASFWSQRARRPARLYLASAPLVDAVGRGAEMIRASIEAALRADATIDEMGLLLVSVNVQRVAPSADVDKALQTPIRESIQQRADQAVFARRAEAVENERAIKQNELSTAIELARRQENLIQREGANRILETRQQAEADELRATAEALSRRMLGEADADAEARHLAVWQAAPTRVLLGLAAQQFAGKIDSINHLNLSPDLLTTTLQLFLREQADHQAA